jgi:hypothetical protein
MRGVVEVELIDLPNRRGPDPDRNRASPNDRRESIPLSHRERLRIADSRDPMTPGSHDDRRRDDGPACRRDADLVDSGDPGQALVPEAALVAEGRDDDGHRASG